MHHVMRVEIVDCRQCLAEELESLSLADVLVLVLVGKERTVFCQLHDHVDYVIFDESVP